MSLIEFERCNWSKVGAANNAAHIPEAITQLQNAECKESAETAYWKIDNTAVVQGGLYEAALYSIPCVLSALGNCTPIARPMLLELLFQLGGGSSCADSEMMADQNSLEFQCMEAVCFGLSQYYHFLEFGTDEEKGYCADLLELCSKANCRMADRARWWLEHLIKDEPNVGLVEIYKGCIQNILENSSTNSTNSTNRTVTAKGNMRDRH